MSDFHYKILLDTVNYSSEIYLLLSETNKIFVYVNTIPVTSFERPIKDSKRIKHFDKCPCSEPRFCSYRNVISDKGNKRYNFPLTLNSTSTVRFHYSNYQLPLYFNNADDCKVTNWPIHQESSSTFNGLLHWRFVLSDKTFCWIFAYHPTFRKD